MAYLIWTLVPRPRTGRESLDEIIDCTGRYGVECAIARYAEELDPFFLTASGEHPVTCDLHLLRKANVRAIRAMLPWSFRSHLTDMVPDFARDFDATFRLFQHRHHFADWSQIVAVARGPAERHPISRTTTRTIASLRQLP